ncbi:MAG TPA: NAD-dependent epimerase/dehydratase family protein [Candidatus Micrarchaeia archaeon]|nr:NAD-dependent epimerase/dehydratase family protein [Candidatus Micrarchaeia archaeon]
MTRGTIMLTGASGFVGGAVLRALLARGYAVQALVRDRERIAPHEGVRVHQGQLADADLVQAACRGCTAVIHCAADYRLALARGDTERMIAANVGGTWQVVDAARRAGAGRVVHCSTVGVLAFTRGGRVVDETMVAGDPSTLPGPYKRSKWAAEQLALAAADVEVVAVLPSTPVGAGDVRPTPTGAVIRDFLRGRIPATVATGLNCVDVEAVGRGHVDALERGRPGRRYILGDRNLWMAELLRRVGWAGGRRPPRWRLPLALAYAVAGASQAVGRCRGEPPAVPLTAVRMAAHPMFVDAARARAELGWDPGDLDRALADAAAWFAGGPARRGA